MSTALNLVYVMLALAVIIAVLGIANTVSLPVHERTRELGLLRAVGLTRRQTRASVRVEAVVVSAFGSVGGVALGALAGVRVRPIVSEHFTGRPLPAEVFRSGGTHIGGTPN